jgi:predicted MFS family arabinose efflux permease
MGYDNGVAGGVASMEGFQRAFFPDIHERTSAPEVTSSKVTRAAVMTMTMMMKRTKSAPHHLENILLCSRVDPPLHPLLQKAAYCKFDDHLLSLFVSSLYLASACGATIGSFTTPRYGRRFTCIFGGLWFIAGSVLQVCVRRVLLCAWGVCAV